MPVYVVGFLNFAAMTLLYPVMPRFADSLGATVTQVGIVVALQPYVAAVTQAPVGLLSDRIGRRLLIFGFMIHLVCFLLYAVVTDIGLLMAVKAFNGLANAAFYPAASALVVDLAAKEKRGQALGLFATSTQLGNMAGPAMGGLILQHFGFQAAFLTSAGIALVATMFALSRMKLVRTGALAGGEKMTWGWLKTRRALASFLATMFIMVGIGSVISFFPLYGKEINIDVARVGFIIASIYLGSVLTRALAGKISDQVGRIPVILTGMLLCTTGVFLISRFTGVFPLHIAAFIYGLGLGSALPACAALIADVAPLSVRGFAMGLNSGSFNAGQAIGATTLGFVAASVGFASMYLVTTISLGTGILIVIFLTRGK
ncbi:MAG: MFS transporter [Dehalococcoidia bacterium]|nr:MFS transporter [Dehalococcoidia bacterium]MDZ4247047.1 MFS transporter [Dehalococcoidia bacterium]